MTRSTGFSAARAEPHEEFCGLIQTALYERGYDPQWLDPDGDEPDISIDGGRAFVDAKTRYSRQRNYAIKHGALEAYLRLTAQLTPVYIVWQDWTVDTVFTLVPRIIGGPRRATGRGSKTDWVLVAPGGTAFADFFPTRIIT